MTQRVWDHYMTEQDQAHNAVHEARRVGYGDKPALLLIDLYRWVFGDSPEPLLDAVKTWPGSCGLAGPILRGRGDHNGADLRSRRVPSLPRSSCRCGKESDFPYIVKKSQSELTTYGED